MNMDKSEIKSWTRINVSDCSKCQGTDKVPNTGWCCEDDDGPYYDRECGAACHYPFQNMSDTEIQNLADWEIMLISGITINPPKPEMRYCCNNGECDGHGNSDNPAPIEENTDMNTLKLNQCIRNNMHLTECDDDGYCNHCGHQDSPPGTYAVATGEFTPDNTPNLTPTLSDYKLATEFLMYHMSMDLRREMMRELPGVYNRINGDEIVKVVRKSNNSDIN